MKRAAMLLAYLLVFLLHLSGSTCDATSRNRHLFVVPAGGAHDATGSSPAIHHHLHQHLLRHTDAAMVLSDYGDVHYNPAMMARRGGPAPRPSPGVGGTPPPTLASAVEPSGVEGAPPPVPRKQEDSAAMEPPPSPVPPPHNVDNDGGSGGGEGAASSSATEQEESATDDVGVDYAEPRTHPPSSN